MKRKKKKVDRYAKVVAQYEDPTVAGSLGGVTRFAKAHKLSAAKVRAKLESSLGYTLHKPTRRHFRTLPVLVYAMDDQWVADLIEVGNIAKVNRGYRYLLTVVDVLSKYAWVEPVKSKTGKDVTAAFEKILRHGRTPRRLQTNDGKEFYNKTFQAFMKRKDIDHFSTSGDTKASVIERFNRTLKQRMYRYFTVKNTLKYVTVLKDLVLGYNRSYHRSIKMAPEQVTVQNEEQVWKNLYARRLGGKRTRPKLKVGDRVRLNKKYRSLKKGTCRDGRRKCLWWVAPWRGSYPLTRSTSDTGHPWRGPFTPKICRKSPSRTTICFGWRRSSNAKGIKCWCIGKVGQTSTTVGSRNVP